MPLKKNFNRSKEHVPAANLFDGFDSSYKINIITVPACITCNLPVYRWVGDPKNTDLEELRRQQKKLQFGNIWRACITLASVILMAAQFGVREVGIVIIGTVIITFPLLLLARKYTPD